MPQSRDVLIPHEPRWVDGAGRAGDGLRLVAFGCSEESAKKRRTVTCYHVHHVTCRRRWLDSRWTEAEAEAEAETRIISLDRKTVLTE